MPLLPPNIVPQDPLSTAASGMSAQRIRMNMLANNLANINTTRDAAGNFKTYLRKEVLLRTVAIDPGKPDEQRVAVHAIVNSKNSTRKIFEPEHPDADQFGYRLAPAVSIPLEMARMIEATRAYEANLNALYVSRGALERTTDILTPSRPDSAI
ncbi:MAG: flagellar basal body rod protein FlgC [Planctomycetes bacterium]|nr:flagellar basal body rod protein FlgC [Planctomycetota bacterium]